MPACSAPTGRSATLYVALRIDTFGTFDNLTLYHAIPFGWHGFKPRTAETKKLKI
jgi:hypothetical protein